MILDSQTLNCLKKQKQKTYLSWKEEMIFRFPGFILFKKKVSILEGVRQGDGFRVPGFRLFSKQKTYLWWPEGVRLGDDFSLWGFRLLKKPYLPWKEFHKEMILDFQTLDCLKKKKKKLIWKEEMIFRFPGFIWLKKKNKTKKKQKKKTKKQKKLVYLGRSSTRRWF